MRTLFGFIMASAVGLPSFVLAPDLPAPGEGRLAAGTDGDRIVSRAEWDAAGLRARRFVALDTNGDSRIDPAEFNAGRDARKARTMGAAPTTPAASDPVVAQATPGIKDKRAARRARKTKTVLDVPVEPSSEDPFTADTATSEPSIVGDRKIG